MARDIEEFLRKAAERRQQQKSGAGKPPESRRPASRPQSRPPEPRPPEPRPPEPRRLEPQVVEAEVVRAKPLTSRVKTRKQQRAPGAKPAPKRNLRDQSVAEHVRSHIDTSSIATHAENLGDRIASVHDKVDASIHRRLDHDLTEIDDTPSVTDNLSAAAMEASGVPMSEQLRRMLQNPKTVGHAILLAEVLKRPDFD
ncbi:hypothetical protein N9B43_01600 [Mariniblastus sp.]|nr:hypothetical protein [Mariniblastus sp.]